MHNGQISGGARKTHKGRPWEMILFVSGFPNKIAGLKFEYILTYPTKSKYYNQISDKNTRPADPKTVNSALKMLIYILSFKPYKNQPLTINFLQKEFYGLFNQKFENLGFKTRLLNDFYVDKQPPVKADKIYFLSRKSVGKCPVCGKATGNQTVRCPVCHQEFCLICLGKWLSLQSGELIPNRGKCFVCQQEIVWKDVLYSMQDEIQNERIQFLSGSEINGSDENWSESDENMNFTSHICTDDINIKNIKNDINKDDNMDNNENDSESDSSSEIIISDDEKYQQQTTPSFVGNKFGPLDFQLLQNNLNYKLTPQEQDQDQQDGQTLTLDDLDINAIKDQDEDQNKQQNNKNTSQYYVKDSFDEVQDLLLQQLSEDQISIQSSSSKSQDSSQIISID